jgi:hypothetical protein
MTDYDELLARADFYLPWHGEEYDLIEDLAAALRAALAARAEPLFEGTVADFIRRFDSLQQPPLVRALDLIEVYRQGAPAGSATPTNRHASGRAYDYADGRRVEWPDDEAAGSATPTGDDDD